MPTRLVVEDAPLGEDQGIVRFHVGERSARPEAGDRAVHERRIERRKRVISDPGLIRLAGAHGLDDDVHAANQSTHLAASRLGVYVESDALLAAIQKEVRRSRPAGIVLGRLDADDIRSEVSEDHRRHRSCESRAQLEHAHTRARSCGS